MQDACVTCVDHVVYMENGEIIADDPFEKVLKNETVVKNIY